MTDRHPDRQSPQSPQVKYRPVLTEAQIEQVLYLAKTQTPTIDTTSMSLISYLTPFLSKIQSRANKPAYTSSIRAPSYNSIESLSETTAQVQASTIERITTKAELWSNAYSKYKLDPNSCSVVDIENAREHMYLDGLMTPEEASNFEAGDIDTSAGGIKL